MKNEKKIVDILSRAEEINTDISQTKIYIFVQLPNKKEYAIILDRQTSQSWIFGG